MKPEITRENISHEGNVQPPSKRRLYHKDIQRQWEKRNFAVSHGKIKPGICWHLHVGKEKRAQVSMLGKKSQKMKC